MGMKMGLWGYNKPTYWGLFWTPFKTVDGGPPCTFWQEITGSTSNVFPNYETTYQHHHPPQDANSNKQKTATELAAPKKCDFCTGKRRWTEANLESLISHHCFLTGGDELWEFSNERTEACDLPLTLDITLLKFEVKQDTDEFGGGLRGFV